MLADTGQRISPVQKHFSQTGSDKITGVFVTDKMFELIQNRIQDETERLYPLIREVKGDSQRAA